MSRPTRDSAAGRAYLDLQARARREGRPTEEIFVLYVLERFLFRLSVSGHRQRVVLKGGMLLAALEERRPTRDVDLLAQATQNDVDSVATLVRDILQVEVHDDGVTYDTDHLTAEVIRDQDLYPGIRVVVPAWVHRAEQRLRVDVSVGDPVTPAPLEIEYPALLDEPFRVLGYPLETVLSEKIVTMVDRGDTTTRERDFADVVLLTRRHAISAAEFRRAVEATAQHRQSGLRGLTEVIGLLGRSRQSAWERFLDRSGLVGTLPETFEDAIEEVIRFADPILTGAVTAGRWLPSDQTWVSE
jgi:hypothetical protein